MSWMDRFFGGGYSRIQIAGVDLPGEVAINFVSGASGVDDPGNDRTNLTIEGGTVLADGDVGDTIEWDGAAWVPVHGAGGWQSYTPTPTNGGFALGDGTLQGFWRYAGKSSIEVTIHLVAGASTSLGAGALVFPMPGGLTWDGAVVPSDGSFGFNASGAYISNVTDSYSGMTAGGADTSSIQVVPSGIGISAGDAVSATSPFVWGVGCFLTATATIPIEL